MTTLESYILSKLIGIPYRRGGRSCELDGGLDCYGFIREYMRLAGRTQPPCYIVEDGNVDAAFAERMDSPEWEKVERPQHLDIAVFKTCAGWHCGIVLEDCVSFAHCSRNGVRVDRLDGESWIQRNRGYYRYDADKKNQGDGEAVAV